MSEVVYVERDERGELKGVYRNAQPGYAEEELPEDHADVAAFLDHKPVPPISKRQALLYLLTLDKTEADVEAAIARIPDATARAAALIEWRYPAGPLHHDHALFAALAPAVGIALKDLPDAFQAAAKL